MTILKTKCLRAALVLHVGAMAISLGLWPGQGLIAADITDRGVFIINLAGRPIGTETFEIKTGKGQVSAEARVQLRVEQQGKTLQFESSPKLILDSDLRPLAYEWSQRGAQSSRLEINLRETPAVAKYHTVTGEDDSRQFDLPRDVIILDNNVIHHYQLAVQRFRDAGGSKQTFHAFIPQEALPGSLTIEEIGREAVDVGGRERRLNHLVLTTDNAKLDLWVDDHDRVQRISIPGAQLDVVRKQ